MRADPACPGKRALSPGRSSGRKATRSAASPSSPRHKQSAGPASRPALRNVASDLSLNFAQQTFHPLWTGRTGGDAEAEGEGNTDNDGGLQGGVGLGVGGQLGEGEQEVEPGGQEAEQGGREPELGGKVD